MVNVVHWSGMDQTTVPPVPCVPLFQERNGFNAQLRMQNAELGRTRLCIVHCALRSAPPAPLPRGGALPRNKIEDPRQHEANDDKLEKGFGPVPEPFFKSPVRKSCKSD